MGSKSDKRWWHSARNFAQRVVPVPGNGHGLLGIAMLAILMLTLGSIGWSKWGATIGRQAQYTLTAESFEITPRPTWIQSDVKAEVVRDGRLTELSALDPDLISNVVQAFEVNTWVAKVIWAGKRPGPEGTRVIVKLRYRKPIIMVRTYDKRWQGDCFWPIDTEGVFLPPDEFSASQTRDFLRVDAGNVSPVGAAGTPFGDPGVTGAAAIAAAIGPDWKSLGLQWIVVRRNTPPGIGQPIDTTYVLLAAGGDPDKIPQRRKATRASPDAQGSNACEVLWGHAPGQEGEGEAAATQKMTRLRMYVTQKGPLDRVAESMIIDLRSNAAVSVIDRHSLYQPASTP